jgi:hypothetical protein
VSGGHSGLRLEVFLGLENGHDGTPVSNLQDLIAGATISLKTEHFLALFRKEG